MYFLLDAILGVSTHFIYVMAGPRRVVTICYEQNCDILNILKYFSCGAVFLISVSEDWSGSGHW